MKEDDVEQGGRGLEAIGGIRQAGENPIFSREGDPASDDVTYVMGSGKTLEMSESSQHPSGSCAPTRDRMVTPE
jgi:hypothetical protein